MLHTTSRAFFPIGEDSTSRKLLLGKKKNAFVSKEEGQVQQVQFQGPYCQRPMDKTCGPGTEDLVFPKQYINTSKRKCRHHHSSHILSPGISRKLLTKVSCNYRALRRPESAKVIMICFEHEQDVKFVKSLPLYFSVPGHFPHSSGLFPPWGLCHRFHRSYRCNPGLLGTQRPSSHCTAVPGAESAHQGSGFFLKREHATVTAFTS